MICVSWHDRQHCEWCPITLTCNSLSWRVGGACEWDDPSQGLCWSNGDYPGGPELIRQPFQSACSLANCRKGMSERCAWAGVEGGKHAHWTCQCGPCGMDYGCPLETIRSPNPSWRASVLQPRGDNLCQQPGSLQVAPEHWTLSSLGANLSLSQRRPWADNRTTARPGFSPGAVLSHYVCGNFFYNSKTKYAWVSIL